MYLYKQISTIQTTEKTKVIQAVIKLSNVVAARHKTNNFAGEKRAYEQKFTGLQ